MQAAPKIRFTLAKLPSKNFIYFKPGKNVNHGVYGELPILSYDIRVEKARPNVESLLRPAFVSRTVLRNPLLTFGEPNVVFERVN